MTPAPYGNTAEWPTGDDIICHLIAIVMDPKGYPTHLFTTNRWITAMVALYQPQIARLLVQRDETINAWAESHDGDVLEDRDREVTSKISLDIKHQIKQISKALKKI
jgi:hypothetical protein